MRYLALLITFVAIKIPFKTQALPEINIEATAQVRAAALAEVLAALNQVHSYDDLVRLRYELASTPGAFYKDLNRAIGVKLPGSTRRCASAEITMFNMLVVGLTIGSFITFYEGNKEAGIPVAVSALVTWILFIIEIGPNSAYWRLQNTLNDMAGQDANIIHLAACIRARLDNLYDRKYKNTYNQAHPEALLYDVQDPESSEMLDVFMEPAKVNGLTRFWQTIARNAERRLRLLNRYQPLSNTEDMAALESPRAETPIDPKLADILKQWFECSYCMERRRNVAYDCGHIILCDQCRVKYFDINCPSCDIKPTSYTIIKDTLPEALERLLQQ